MSQQRIGFGDRVEGVVRSPKKSHGIRGYAKVVCKDKEGNVKWIEEGENIIPDQGINWILTNDLAGATVNMGLMTGTPSPLAAWTLASAVAVEAAGYSEGTRPAWGQGEPSTQAVTNATAVTFTMDGTDTTIGGAFLVVGNSTKDSSAGDGSTAWLIAAKAFTGGNKTVANLDTLDVTYTITGDSP